jgi:hypothetical protein
VRRQAPADVGCPPLSARRPPAVFLALLSLAACREPPARAMRRIEGVNVELRAVGLPRPHETVLDAAFAAVTRIDGAAVDRAAATLRAAGARKGLVNLGGDRLAVFGEPLVVAVPDPADPIRPRWASFTLADASLARASRAEGLVLAVTVVARTAGEAETLAVSALPLSAADALALLQRRGAAGFVQAREDSRRVIAATPGFAAAHDLRPEEDVRVQP